MKSLVSAIRTYFFTDAAGQKAPIGTVKSNLDQLEAQDRVDLAFGLLGAGLLTADVYQKELAKEKNRGATPDPSYKWGGESLAS